MRGFEDTSPRLPSTAHAHGTARGQLSGVQGTEGAFHRNGDALAHVLPVLICHAKSQLQVASPPRP